MNSTTSKTLVETVLDNPEALADMVAYELASSDEIEAIKRQYESFVADLEQEWPFRKIQQFLLERNKWLQQRTKELIEKTELENRDARTRGESYQQRKRFTSKISVGYKYLLELEVKAMEIKDSRYSVRGMVKPKDISLVERFGFARYLKLFY